jgi:tetratricopeptide (TPR) repeat protein
MIRYAKIHAVSGRRDEALKIAQNLETRASESSAADSNIALIYVGLGDNDKAMIWLNKAYQARFNPSILLRPAFDPLRSDVRFQDLWRRIGLP